MVTEICPVCEKTNQVASEPEETGYRTKVCMSCYLALEAERIGSWKTSNANAKKNQS